MTRAAIVGLALLLVACGSPDQDKLPDDLTASEGTAAPQPDVEPEPEPEPEPALADAVEPPPSDPLAPLEPTDVPASARPSFDCSGSLNRVEIMVCTSPELARLDRQVSSAFARAMDEADPDQESRLRRLGARYLADRNRCPTTECVTQAYRWYQRDIHLVMDWPGP